MTEEINKPLLKLSEVARMLRVAAPTVAAWTKKNLIPSVVLPSGQHRYKAEDIEEVKKKMRL